MELKKFNALHVFETLFLSLIITIASFFTYYYFNTLIYDYNFIDHQSEKGLKMTFIHLMFVSCGVVNGALTSIGLHRVMYQVIITRLLIGPILFYIILFLSEYHGGLSKEVVAIHTHYLPASIGTFICITWLNVLFLIVKK